MMLPYTTIKTNLYPKEKGVCVALSAVCSQGMCSCGDSTLAEHGRCGDECENRGQLIECYGCGPAVLRAKSASMRAGVEPTLVEAEAVVVAEAGRAVSTDSRACRNQKVKDERRAHKLNICSLSPEVCSNRYD